MGFYGNFDFSDKHPKINQITEKGALAIEEHYKVILHLFVSNPNKVLYD
jgi:hypothetical protein